MEAEVSFVKPVAISSTPKRFFDIIAAGTALTVLSPLLAVVAIIIKLDSPGPVVFRQERVGKGGGIFNMFKFRTMQQDAELHKKDLKHLNEADGPVFKMKNDPRVTRAGAFLRRHCLDELLQLFNILMGDMSVVGPRPPTPDELLAYKAWHYRRFEATPGLTCIWQVNNDRTLAFDDWVKLDIEYIETRNFLLDMKLILKTIPIVIFGQH